MFPSSMPQLNDDYNKQALVPVEDSHLFTNLLFFIQREQVRHLASIQQVVNIFQERLLFYLKR